MNARWNKPQDLDWRTAHEELDRQLARGIFLVLEAAGVDDLLFEHERTQREAAIGMTPAHGLRRMEVFGSIHLLLRIRSNERREKRQQVEERQKHAAGDRQR